MCTLLVIPYHVIMLMFYGRHWITTTRGFISTATGSSFFLFLVQENPITPNHQSYKGHVDKQRGKVSKCVGAIFSLLGLSQVCWHHFERD